uniref:Poly [ADP-ribose] polymerase n=1 Tax=Neogobius melanostomus TaxID=47308 RepID=A0A8C6TH21_9GOBI
MALFQHCSVLFELKELPFKEKKKIKLAVTDNGGKISFVANKECSLIVTSDVSSLSPGRIRNIVKHQIPVVGLNYVQRCVEADCLLPVEDFKLDVSSTNYLPAACKDTKGNFMLHNLILFFNVPLVEKGSGIYNERDSGLPKFPESFQVAKYSLFQKSNGQSWCLLELQSAKSESGRKYRWCGTGWVTFTAAGGEAPHGALSTEVGQFVELLWQEALGCIDLILNTPVHKISLNDLSLKSQCVMLLNEYCTLLPQRSPVGPDMSSISKQFDLCQVIRDILNVSEMTLGSTVPSSVGKYRALRCSIEAVPKGSSEFETVTSLLQHSKVQVHQILRVDRAPELQSFKRELGNIKPLLHSSRPHNFVGILSRGLLMPCVAVSQHGIIRTDAGNLGSGIYFSDEINTTLKYSQCSLTDGSRLVLVCDVALGRCKDFRKKDLTLIQAPEGHDSVHGVRNAPGLQSEFMDNEYVVYSPDQVKLKYVVQLSSQGDELKSFTPGIVQSDEPLSSPSDQGPYGLSVKNPLDTVTAGLLNSSGQQIPLQAVHVKCKLVDLLAQVIIFQKYTNESSMPIEAKYVFPLDDSAAVCGFEAFINGKHVVGQVKEKETARREYKQAIEKGHGAYLMDQDAPDVFTISVGNLPPGATVLIKVTFVSELIVKDGSIFFSLPSSVAPWQESAALNQTTQKLMKAFVSSSFREFNLDMSIEMPHQITEVTCVTHQVKLKKTDCKAVVSVLPGEVMGPEGFQLLVTLTEVHVPRMWVEQHPNKDSQACMLVFYPNFEAASSDKSDEVVLLLDASQSMKGESLNSARMIALQILKTLDHNVSVNVIFFGTDHTEAFLSAKPIDEARLETKNFIKHFSSAGGSTELWRPLRALSLLPPSSGMRNLLLLSDGHIQNTELTLQLLRDNAPHTRLFTCGLSPTANRHMLRALAQAGGGAYEFFDSKSKHTWSEKVASQIKRLQAPGASSVSVKWQQFNPTAPPPVQAPKQLHALFNDCHTLVFGFVPHCTLLGNLSGQEIETMTFLSKLNKIIHFTSLLNEEKKAELKSFVIELSKEFSVLSQFTSFVAIEERESEEEKGFTDIPELIAEEDVDFLPYMSWASMEDFDEEDSYDQVSSSSPDSVVNETPHFLMGDSIIESLSTSDESDMDLMGLMDSLSPSDLMCKRSSKSLPEPVDSLVTPASIEVSEAISAPFISSWFKCAKRPIPPEHPLSDPEGYWELTPKLGMLLNCDVSRFANDFLRRKGIASLGEKAHADILKLLATLLVLQLMRLEKILEGQLLRTLFCLEDNKFRSDHWDAVNRAVEWARWADRQYPCVYSRLEFGLSWDSSTKQLLGAERIHHCSPLTGLNLNPRPTMVL